MSCWYVGMAYGEYKGIERKIKNGLHHKFDFFKNSALIDQICVLFYVHFYCGGMNAHIEDEC